ncbi:MAG: PP2C family protein-serine/threonine phosphatase [Phycisphaerales bacterium JB038]
MHCLETRHNPRIADLMEAVIAISRAERPEEVNVHLAYRFQRLFKYEAFLSLSRRSLPTGEYKITRRLDAQGLGDPDLFRADNPWRDWAKLPTHVGGFLGEVTAGRDPAVMHDLLLADDPVLGDEYRDMGSCMVVPLFDGGEPLNWAVFFRRDPHGFSIDDLEQSILTGNMVGKVTRNLVMAAEVRELNAKLKADLEEVAKLQLALLPEKLPRIPTLELGSSYLTADEAGGDYYDFFELDGGRWGLIVADVSGHGVAAGTVMALTHASLSAADQAVLAQPDLALTHLNRSLMHKQLGGHFVTAFYGVYDPADGLLRFTSAGHPPPRRKLPSGTVEPLNSRHTFPLGIEESLPVRVAETRLLPTETLVLYTDGIVEAFNPQHDMFSVARLDQAISGCSGMPDCVIDSVHQALYQHTGEMTRADDQTIVALRREEG